MLPTERRYVFGISMWELVLILLVALILLGPRQLTETARVVGRLYRELQRLTSEVRNTIDLDSISSPASMHHGSPIQQTQLKQPIGDDHDVIQPPGEKSGPDFYAELLEKSAESGNLGTTQASGTPESPLSPEEKKEKTVGDLKT
jgi:Sec-independent protein translocase protein TatA